MNDKDKDYIVVAIKSAKAVQELMDTVSTAYGDLFYAIYEELEKRERDNNKNE